MVQYTGSGCQDRRREALRRRVGVWRGSAFEKLAFYGMIGEAVNELHAENPGASERATMRVVIAAARGMLERG